ncbi:MAG TPA: acyl carrier protein [Solirubrobacteraceae bacterium]|nr:acyl carrier protein [Solirubrobacteraceae bacterium]
MTTEDRIRTFVLDELNFDGDPSELTPDFPLIDRHVVDSLGIMQMVTFLEEELGVAVADDDVVPEHFESVRRIAELVEARRGARR